MGKIAFVFSGQGDQYSGMGKDLFARFPSSKSVFELCDNIRPGTSSQCFNGSEDELKETKNTQPCLFAVELAAVAALSELGIKPDAVAGFSLGEVAACTAAGYVDLKSGFSLVCKRGELMQEASEEYDTYMAAVVKLSKENVEELCAKYPNVYPVNYNCPGQISVAGLTDEMIKFSADVKSQGGRALPIKIKGAFHSPFLTKASEEFTKILSDVRFSKGNITLYSNLTATPYTDDVVNLLGKQICNPVRWENLIRNMISSGINTFIEIGPGKTLTNMIGKIDPDVKRYCISELDVLVSEVQPC